MAAGLVSAEDYHRAADLPSVRGTTAPRGRALDEDELAQLFARCALDRSPAGLRDAAVLAVLYGCGLRRSELVGLDVADYATKDGALRIRSGKGNKARTNYATGGVRTAIEAWLKARGTLSGPLFCPVNKSGKIAYRRLTDQAVRKMLLKRAREAGVEHFSPHDLRRTMIGDLLDAGADISTVQRLAGHANVTTTALPLLLRPAPPPPHPPREATNRKAAGLLPYPLTQVTTQTKRPTYRGLFAIKSYPPYESGNKGSRASGCSARPFHSGSLLGLGTYQSLDPLHKPLAVNSSIASARMSI